MTEAELLGKVIEQCVRLGLLWHHCRDSRRCSGHAGFPDLLIAGPGGAVVVELKGPDGDTSADQDMWLWVLHRGGKIPAVVRRPQDWETICRELEEIA